MNTIESITSIMALLVLAHTTWVLAYIASPRRILDERMDWVTA